MKLLLARARRKYSEFTNKIHSGKCDKCQIYFTDLDDIEIKQTGAYIGLFHRKSCDKSKPLQFNLTFR